MAQGHAYGVVHVEPQAEIEIIGQLDPAARLLDQQQATAPAMVRMEQPQEPIGERVHAASRRRQSPSRVTRAGFKPNSSTVPERYML
jgi:hypothetical protein